MTTSLQLGVLSLVVLAVSMGIGFVLLGPPGAILGGLMGLVTFIFTYRDGSTEDSRST